MQSTRQLCPRNVPTLSMFLLSQILMAFMEYPCVDTSSLELIEYIILHTCEPVSIFFRHLFSLIFHTLIDLSVEPPPVDSMQFWCGDQASALTAAVCQLNLCITLLVLISQMQTRLSLPPEATILPSNDHFTPHTYCLCDYHLLAISRDLISQTSTVQSLDPLAIRLLLQSIVPIRPLWLRCLPVSLFFSMSIMRSLPVYSPTMSPLPHLILLIKPYTSFYVQFSLLFQIQAALSSTTDTRSY